MNSNNSAAQLGWITVVLDSVGIDTVISQKLQQTYTVYGRVVLLKEKYVAALKRIEELEKMQNG